MLALDGSFISGNLPWHLPLIGFMCLAKHAEYSIKMTRRNEELKRDTMLSFWTGNITETRKN